MKVLGEHRRLTEAQIVSEILLVLLKAVELVQNN